ncbi:hypothetical protein H0W91_00265 [Patescibacteria group bacterium]|nr:hypothetical protein [Patescibacteria group bacterium]
MSFNNLPQREEYLKKKRNKRLIRYTIILVVIFFILGLSSFISYRQKLRISKVELSGGILLTSNEIERESLDFLGGSYFWLYPKNNYFWYPKIHLENDLRDIFKRIDTIKISPKNFHTLSIVITEKKPFAIWCDNLPNNSVTEQCYFLDQNSTIFAESPYFSGDAYFKYYGEISSSSPIGSQYIASSTEFSEISRFIDFTRSISLHPIYLVSKGGGEYSLVLRGGGEIYFDTKESLSKVMENLVALLKSKVFVASSTPDLPIQYIDMRYGNKLFYKLK